MWVALFIMLFQVLCSELSSEDRPIIDSEKGERISEERQCKSNDDGIMECNIITKNFDDNEYENHKDSRLYKCSDEDSETCLVIINIDDTEDRVKSDEESDNIMLSRNADCTPGSSQSCTLRAALEILHTIPSNYRVSLRLRRGIFALAGPLPPITRDLEIHGSEAIAPTKVYLVNDDHDFREPSGDAEDFRYNPKWVLNDRMPQVQIATVLDGQEKHQIFRVEPNIKLSLNTLSLENGYSVAGGGIYNQGVLKMTNVELRSNKAVNGGGMYNMGSISMDYTFSQLNTAEVCGGLLYTIDDPSLNVGMGHSTFDRNTDNCHRRTVVGGVGPVGPAIAGSSYPMLAGGSGAVMAGGGPMQRQSFDASGTIAFGSKMNSGMHNELPDPNNPHHDHWDPGHHIPDSHHDHWNPNHPDPDPHHEHWDPGNGHNYYELHRDHEPINEFDNPHSRDHYRLLEEMRLRKRYQKERNSKIEVTREQKASSKVELLCNPTSHGGPGGSTSQMLQCGSAGKCFAWRQTLNCDPNGARAPEADKPCDAVINNGSEGYCDCENGRAAVSNCSHPPFNCAMECARAVGTGPNAAFVTGAYGNAGHYLDRVGLICSDGTRTKQIGGTGGRSWEFECPVGSGLSALHIKAGAFVDGIQLGCSPLPPEHSHALANIEQNINSNSFMSPLYGGSGGDKCILECPVQEERYGLGRSSGLIIQTINIRGGNVIDWVQVDQCLSIQITKETVTKEMDTKEADAKESSSPSVFDRIKNIIWELL